MVKGNANDSKFMNIEERNSWGVALVLFNKVIDPDVGWSSPANKLINVDLPAPEVPMIATDSPALILNEIPFRMDNWLSLLITDLVIFSTLIMD